MIWALILLSLLLLTFLLLPLWRQDRSVEINQSEENLHLYKERTDELSNSDLDDEQKAALQLELDREFLASADGRAEAAVPVTAVQRWPVALAMLVVVLAGTLLCYHFWGAADEIRATELLEKASQVELTQPERDELIRRLHIAAERHPDNVEWIYLYARMLNVNGDFDEAAKVFADILVQLPEGAVADRAATLTLLAQARFFAADQHADEETYGLLKEAVQLEPANRQAQGLAGMLAFELQDYRAAISHWRQVWLTLPDSPEAQMLAQGIVRAAGYLREQGEEVDLGWMKRAEIKVLVDLSPAARAAASPADTVFVLARAISGPPMPLAVQKLTVAQLPQVVTLSDVQAMAPGMNLSSHEQVTVIARLSKSGQPLAQSGDWQIMKTPVSNHESEILKLTISELVP